MFFNQYLILKFKATSSDRLAHHHCGLWRGSTLIFWYYKTWLLGQLLRLCWLLGKHYGSPDLLRVPTGPDGCMTRMIRILHFKIWSFINFIHYCKWWVTLAASLITIQLIPQSQHIINSKSWWWCEVLNFTTRINSKHSNILNLKIDYAMEYIIHVGDYKCCYFRKIGCRGRIKVRVEEGLVDTK